MIQDGIVERISVMDGMLIIQRKYMALQTSDGVLHPADMDDYGEYIWTESILLRKSTVSSRISIKLL